MTLSDGSSDVAHPMMELVRRMLEVEIHYVSSCCHS